VTFIFIVGLPVTVMSDAIIRSVPFTVEVGYEYIIAMFYYLFFSTLVLTPGRLPGYRDCFGLDLFDSPKISPPV